MKEDNFNENNLSLDEMNRKKNESSSSPTEAIKYLYTKLKKTLSTKKCKKNFFFILALLFVVLAIYYIKIKKVYTFMKKTKKTQEKINNKKQLDSKGGKIIKDKEGKTKRIGKYKIEEIKSKIEMKEKDDIKKIDKYLSKKKDIINN